MYHLQAGANLAIDKTDFIDVTVSWLPENSALDACAFVLDPTEKALSNHSFVDQNRTKSGDGFVTTSVSAGKQHFHIDLGKAPKAMEKIVFAAASQTEFTQYFDLNIEANGQVIFTPTFEAMQSLILAELYLRNGQWKFRAVGQGFKQGLDFLVQRYGVDLSEQAAPDIQEAPPIAPPAPPKTELVQKAAETESQNPPPAHHTPHDVIEANLELVKKFSWPWVAYSALIIIGVELVLAGLFGNMVVGRFMHTLYYALEVILILVSYFVGGAIIGVVSPGIRILEPALGAFICVLLTFSISFFSPYSFIVFSWTKVIFGGGIAFGLALLGARAGEKLSAKFGVKASREYFGEE